MGRKRKLTDEQIEQIITHPNIPAKDWARQFGVSIVTVYKAKHGAGTYTRAIRYPENASAPSQTVSN